VVKERVARREEEPRQWAVVVTLATVGLFAALPPSLSLLPDWLLVGAVLLLILPVIWTARARKYQLNTALGIALIVLLSLVLISAVGQLVIAIVFMDPRWHPRHLLLSAVLIWCTNVLVFSLWYWRVDAGGPNGRDLRRRSGEQHARASFLFPQMTMSAEEQARHGFENWHPTFVDYLFLAFCTSTALSPADTAVLTPVAKILVMAQASLSLVIIAVVAARAVNILN
jgi:hypothetical protein